MKGIGFSSFSRLAAALTAVAGVALVGLILPAANRSSGADAVLRAALLTENALGQSPQPTGRASADPARVMGARACTECHRLEYVAWTKSKHYGSLDAKLDPDNPNVQKYCAALGIDLADLRNGSACVTCHALPQSSDSGQVRAVTGVSCESCHGAAGGEDGWLNRHAVYGPNVTRRTEEIPRHRQERITHCEKAGMIRAGNLYGIARNCLGCHLIGNEKLVLEGHPVGSAGFELVSWSLGEVRHNFHADVQTPSTTNAEAPRLWTTTTGKAPEERRRMKFVLGVLADLEMSLRHRGKASNAAFIAQLGGRVGGLNGKLAQIAPAAQAQEVTALQGAVGGALARLFTPMPDDGEYYANLADKVAEAAAKFAETHDGSGLAALDALLQATPPKGEPPYQP